MGELLDTFDRLGLWEDTWIVMSTDHGLLLGEKEYLGKNRPPFYNEVAHIPLLIAPPRNTRHRATPHARRSRRPST